MLGLEKELEIFVHAVIAGMAVYGTYTAESDTENRQT